MEIVLSSKDCPSVTGAGIIAHISELGRRKVYVDRLFTREWNYSRSRTE